MIEHGHMDDGWKGLSMGTACLNHFELPWSAIIDRATGTKCEPFYRASTSDPSLTLRSSIFPVAIS